MIDAAVSGVFECHYCNLFRWILLLIVQGGCRKDAAGSFTEWAASGRVGS